MIGRILPTRRPEKGGTRREQWRPGEGVDAVDVVFGLDGGEKVGSGSKTMGREGGGNRVGLGLGLGQASRGEGDEGRKMGNGGFGKRLGYAGIDETGKRDFSSARVLPRVNHDRDHDVGSGMQRRHSQSPDRVGGIRNGQQSPPRILVMDAFESISRQESSKAQQIFENCETWNFEIFG